MAGRSLEKKEVRNPRRRVVEREVRVQSLAQKVNEVQKEAKKEVIKRPLK